MSSFFISPAHLVFTVEPCVLRAPQPLHDEAKNWDTQGAQAQVQGLKDAR